VAGAQQITQLHLALKFRLSEATPQTPPVPSQQVWQNFSFFTFLSQSFYSPLSPPFNVMRMTQGQNMPNDCRQQVFPKQCYQFTKHHSFTTQKRATSATTSKKLILNMSDLLIQHNHAHLSIYRRFQ
jgi:hypothetical protein